VKEGIIHAIHTHLLKYSPARNRAHLRASIQRPLSRRRDCRLPALLSRFPLELAATPAAAASENAGEAAPAPRVRGALGRKDFVRAAAAVCGGGGLSEAHAAALVARCDPRGASAPARLRSFARAHVGTGRFGVGAMWRCAVRTSTTVALTSPVKREVRRSFAGPPAPRVVEARGTGRAGRRGDRSHVPVLIRRRRAGMPAAHTQAGLRARPRRSSSTRAWRGSYLTCT
jgi:hypothetical protein